MSRLVALAAILLVACGETPGSPGPDAEQQAPPDAGPVAKADSGAAPDTRAPLAPDAAAPADARPDLLPPGPEGGPEAGDAIGAACPEGALDT